MMTKPSVQAAPIVAVSKPRRTTAVQLACCLRLSILSKLRALKSALLVVLIALTMVSGHASAAAAVTRNKYRVASPGISTMQKRRMSARQRNAPKARKVSAFVILATFVASSYRASLGQKRVARTTTPFGVIKNVSVLGNGVSIIRVSMTLETDSESVDRLKEMDSRHSETMSLILRMPVTPTERIRLRQLYQSEYISRGNTFCGVVCIPFVLMTLTYLIDEVATYFHSLLATKHPRLGSLDSMRVPFVEEAAREFGSIVSDEREMFKKVSDTNENSNFIAATILIAIKGDKTAVLSPLGVRKGRDITLQLSNIARDSTVDGCLIDSAFFWKNVKGTQEDLPGLTQLA